MILNNEIIEYNCRLFNEAREIPIFKDFLNNDSYGTHKLRHYGLTEFHDFYRHFKGVINSEEHYAVLSNSRVIDFDEIKFYILSIINRYLNNNKGLGLVDKDKDSIECFIFYSDIFKHPNILNSKYLHAQLFDKESSLFMKYRSIIDLYDNLDIYINNYILNLSPDLGIDLYDMPILYNIKNNRKFYQNKLSTSFREKIIQNETTDILMDKMFDMLYTSGVVNFNYFYDSMKHKLDTVDYRKYENAQRRNESLDKLL